MERGKSCRASKNRELKIKVHIQMTPDNNKFNRDIGLELPGCWLSMLRAITLQDITRALKCKPSALVS